MRQFAKTSLFFLHLIGFTLCLLCTLVSIDCVITLIPRYTSLGGWLSHLEADPTHVVWLTTWSLALAALPAMGLFCLDSPRPRQRRRKRPLPVRNLRPSPALPAARSGEDELVISWVGEEADREDVLLKSLPSPLLR